MRLLIAGQCHGFHTFNRFTRLSDTEEGDGGSLCRSISPKRLVSESPRGRKQEALRVSKSPRLRRADLDRPLFKEGAEVQDRVRSLSRDPTHLSPEPKRNAYSVEIPRKVQSTGKLRPTGSPPLKVTLHRSQRRGAIEANRDLTFPESALKRTPEASSRAHRQWSQGDETPHERTSPPVVCHTRHTQSSEEPTTPDSRAYFAMVAGSPDSPDCFVPRTGGTPSAEGWAAPSTEVKRRAFAEGECMFQASSSSESLRIPDRSESERVYQHSSSCESLQGPDRSDLERAYQASSSCESLVVPDRFSATDIDAGDVLVVLPHTAVAHAF